VESTLLEWFRKRKWNIISLVLSMILAASCGAVTYYETFEVCDLLWYLNKLKITPNEFFAFALERTSNPRDFEENERIPFEIYLGEEDK